MNITSSGSRAPGLLLPAALGAVLLALTACASTPPPTAQVAVSAAAVAHAADAGAPEFAPADLTAARDKLGRANLAMAGKDYSLALALAQEAQVDARLAEAKAEAAKARKAADAVQEDSRVLRDEISRKTP